MTIFVCSSPSARHAYAADPRGHCPECVKAGHGNWSEITRQEAGTKEFDYSIQSHTEKVNGALSAARSTNAPLERLVEAAVDAFNGQYQVDVQFNLVNATRSYIALVAQGKAMSEDLPGMLAVAK